LIDIAIVRSNSVIYDPRVRKIVGSLSKKYSLAVLGWNREGRSIKASSNSDFHQVILCNLKAPACKKRLVLYLPLFWAWYFIN